MALTVRTSARAAMWRAIIWIFASLIFLDVAVSKALQLHATGMAVSPWRTIQVVFWGLMLPLWIWQAWSNWRASKRQ